jgi:hypothetical protein
VCGASAPASAAPRVGDTARVMLADGPIGPVRRGRSSRPNSDS